MKRRRREKDHILQLVTCYWHIIKSKQGSKIEPWGTPQEIDAGWEKLFPENIQKRSVDRTFEESNGI